MVAKKKKPRSKTDKLLNERVMASASQKVREAMQLEGRERKCIAKSSRTGELCKRWAIKGGTVCPFHGGSAPQVKAAAAKRLREMVDPALDRLEELVMQDEHKPTALGAIETVLKRAGDHAIGPVGTASAPEGPKGLTVNIGVKIGALPAKTVTNALPPAPDVDAEIIEG
jgi:hypothetical protein